MTRVAVAGATGQVGRSVVAALRDAGHEPVELSRARGVDVLTGDGLDAALTGADAVIDVLSTGAADPDKAIGFFTRTSDHLLAAGRRHGVRHHVLLSIVNVDAVPDNGHYLGKVAQEQRVEAGPVPWTILRTTQFHSFAEMVAGRTARHGVAAVAPLLVQPVDVGDVALVLVELALGEPQGRTADLAGPDTMDLVDMAVRTLAARGVATTVRASWSDSPFGVSMAGEVLLPGPGARIGGTSFTAWLARGTGDPRALASAYFEAWQARDFGRLGSLLASGARFRGPLGTADSRDECVAGLRGMTKIMTGLEITRMVADGPDVMTWYDLLTPEAPPTPTVNWMHVENGLISRIRVAFDPRGLLGLS
ncbi:MAG TPA: nuclear transport factor 2 family protein [Streptosporangiaceae bacterium]